MNLFLKLIFFKYTRIVLPLHLRASMKARCYGTLGLREQSPFIAADVNIAH